MNPTSGLPRHMRKAGGVDLDLLAVLRYFLALTDSLREFQRAQGPHLALCPFNISTAADGTVSLGREEEAAMAYISPEQTGRMNRQVDQRSDHYSLGVIFYEVLTGRPPFESDNAMEVIYGHIAKQPLAPNAINADLPQVLCDIVLKLISKNAEDRYQSLEGLAADLRRCIDGIEGSGGIDRFKLGEHDVSERLQMPQKLYGREVEVAQLLAAFDRIAEGGVELLLVTGYSGIGKSSLVHEAHKPVAARRGYFICGKFDQFKRNVPYSAINQAFRELMRQILTESESRIAMWRSKLLKALGANGQLMIEAVPELEYIIGKQAPVPALSGVRNSYNYVLQNFVDVFTRQEHPIVLFLDDLQWADTASLKLIDLLMKSLDDPCLLVVGAYRDNEVDAAHPLMIAIDGIKSEAAVSTIEVTALPQKSINELIADTFHASPSATAPLAELIYHKTLGNPFFVSQFLKSLYNDKLLQFEGGRWRWNVAQIDALDITDNVVDLLMKELRRLPEATQRLLTLASCIGNRFDLQTLATVSEKPVETTSVELQQAIVGGLIRISGTSDSTIGAAGTIFDSSFDSFFFLHDRVQQAAYEGIPEDEKKAVHLKIGRLLQNSMAGEQLEERIFDVVHQMNEGRSLITEPADRNALALLNLRAAQKARKTAAFELHNACIEIVLEFGGAQDWRAKPAFMHELYMELISAAFARADYVEMERLCQVVCDNSASAREAIAAKDMLTRSYAASYKPKELLKTGIESLALAGVKVPENLGRRHIWLARARLSLALRGKDPMELVDLGPVKDEQYLLELQASNLFLAYGFTYLADSNVVLWVAIEMIRKAVRHGISPYCTYAFAVWGRTLAGKLGKPEQGYRFGKASAELAARKGILGAVGIFHGIIRHRKEHLRLALQPLMDTYVKAMEIGDRASAVVALSFSDAIRFQSGGKVNDALNQIRKDIGIYRKMNYPAVLGVMIPWALLFAKLVGESVNELSQGMSEDDFVAARRAGDDPWGVFYIRSIQCMGEYYFGDYESAAAHAGEAMQLPGFDFGTPASGFLLFTSSLVLLARCSPDEAPSAATLAQVAKNQRKFKVWADHAPVNYLHKWQLVEAECYRVRGKTEDAVTAFELAIKGARDNWFWNDEALANEVAGRFYQGAGKEMNARLHMEEAHAKYVEWGALAKARQMEALYPRLLSRVIGRKGAVSTLNSESRVDIDTVIKASQTLSGEIQLERLLAKLMRLLIANAGAQKGILLLHQDGQLVVRAQAQDEVFEVQQQIAAEDARNLSLAIVHYVRRTRQKVVLGDAAADSQFNSESYIAINRPKSVLCIPLQKQSELIGILYLENNLAVDAFTAGHTELLEMLSTQIAISLENAGLYTELEQKIALRTQALSRKNAELSDTLDSLKQAQRQLVESEKLASLGQLVAGVAHEINTPVGVGVTGASTLADETARIEALYRSGEMKRSDLERYVNTAATISRLLLSNMERAATLTQSFKEVAIDQTSQERRTFRLDEYIGEVLLNLNPILRKTEHKIEIECSDSIMVDSYPGALSQIITNLVMNALLHAFNEGSAGIMRIVVRELNAGMIELRFSDNGKGIPEENLAKIFDPFFTTKRGHGGSGLGLSIIHNLANGTLMGQINVESRVGAGTTFTLLFPRKIAPSVVAAHAADAANEEDR
ncbi:MAG TPA: AAA family ATPase [Burkholderiaceae bacterium]|jgi:predicted ATPase/signal transduction histidine kinase